MEPIVNPDGTPADPIVDPIIKPADPIVDPIKPASPPAQGKSDLHALITVDEAKALGLEMYAPDVQKGILIQYLKGKINAKPEPVKVTGNPQISKPGSQTINTPVLELTRKPGRELTPTERGL